MKISSLPSARSFKFGVDLGSPAGGGGSLVTCMAYTSCNRRIVSLGLKTPLGACLIMFFHAEKWVVCEMCWGTYFCWNSARYFWMFLLLKVAGKQNFQPHRSPLSRSLEAAKSPIDTFFWGPSWMTCSDCTPSSRAAKDGKKSMITKHLRYLKRRNSHLYKLYGYGLWIRGNPPPK